ncbi:hypothetical protein ABZ766_32115 [Streptomyces sp. NPDC006670]|uniref:hypothetical protein n=1 Tax=Streptomyces sp. NPDC006670 TaxID=3154476 RepID=UPI0033D71123
MKMKRMKTAVVAAAVAAVTALGSAPAEALPAGICDLGQGVLYVCDYGLTQRHFPGGVEQFIIGSDYAVWTRWYYNDNTTNRFSDWVSLGGVARSEVFLEGERDDGSFIARITVIGFDGKPWQRVRPDIGGSWTAWQVAPNVG